MKTYKKMMCMSVAIFSMICCNQAMAQTASEKPVSSFYSKLAKEKLEKQRVKKAAPVLRQQLPGNKPLPRHTMEAVEKRRQKAQY